MSSIYQVYINGWPEAKVIRKPDTEKVIAFLKEYIARHGIPQTIRTDPATIYRSNGFKEFCEKRYIKHVECLIGDHKCNGEIERLICTINKRLLANKEKVVRKDNSGLSKTLFALRMNPSAKNNPPYERYNGQEPNTIKNNFN